MKIAGQKVSSSFVSGANAMLVGIRYAFQLPYPPIQSLNSFIYQNANGQVTSMIVGPTAISSVSNPLGQPIVITTALAYGLVTGSTVTFAGIDPNLLAALGGQAAQVITAIDSFNFQVNGSLGTGISIAVEGTITGYNFVSDLNSQPARLTPIFGQMWPVARVVVNAIQMNFTVGFATPISVTTNNGNPTITSTYPK